MLHAKDRFGHEVATGRLSNVGVLVPPDADMFMA